MSSDGSQFMADSAYEIIYTDDESQDGRGTESLFSIDSPRTDDVHSISGIERVYDDENPAHEDDQDDDDIEEHRLSALEHSSRRSNSIEYADHALRTPSPHSGDASLQSLQLVNSLGLSIDFSELNDHRHRDRNLVKHIIRTFSEEESARVAQNMAIDGHPRSFVAAIRQTMCADYLSTNGPLRILYIGSDSARYDIIYKISSALTASTSTEDPRGSFSSQGSDRIYNIVPVSAFGSSKIPEVELMETSAFQIKVENCTAAEEAATNDDANPRVYFRSAGFTLIINGERTVSLPLPRKAPVQPDWELPHVAVFYCTDNDDDSLKMTRDAAWGAMASRDVPCLFIAHDLDFEKPPSTQWRGYIDPDTLHISLESSDPSQNVVPARLPVDLNSFLAIDARQMNRNLAYITGLRGGNEDMGRKIHSFNLRQSSKATGVYLSNLIGTLNWSSILARVALTAVILGVGYLLGGYLSLGSPQDVTSLSMSASSALSSSSHIQTTTATVTVEHTSTKTIEVPRPDLSSAPWFFDSVIWPVPGRPVFTASKGANAVLLKIDTDYSHFVIPGRVRVTVHRGNEPVVAQITVHNGQAVLVEFGRHEAYGVLTVRVETTQKPRVHESYEIDFGRPLGLFDMPFSYVHSFALNLAAAANETARSVPQSCGFDFQALSEAMFDQAASRSSSLFQQLKDASQYTFTFAQRAKGDAGRALAEARQKLADRFSCSAVAQQKADLALRKAQISSKLWWLKLQGKRQEYEMYEQKAIKFLEEKMQRLSKTTKGRQTQDRTSVMSFMKGSW